MILFFIASNISDVSVTNYCHLFVFFPFVTHYFFLSASFLRLHFQKVSFITTNGRYYQTFGNPFLPIKCETVQLPAYHLLQGKVFLRFRCYISRHISVSFHRNNYILIGNYARVVIFCKKFDKHVKMLDHRFVNFIRGMTERYFLPSLFFRLTKLSKVNSG